MPYRVAAKRRQKKGENRPLFAFCAVLPTEQENKPALQTLLTSGKIPIAHMQLLTPNINRLHMWTEIAATFEKNIAFSCLKCYNRYIPETKRGCVHAKTATMPSDLWRTTS